MCGKCGVLLSHLALCFEASPLTIAKLYEALRNNIFYSSSGCFTQVVVMVSGRRFNLLGGLL
jgi:hypothetical protein